MNIETKFNIGDYVWGHTHISDQEMIQYINNPDLEFPCNLSYGRIYQYSYDGQVKCHIDCLKYTPSLLDKYVFKTKIQAEKSLQRCQRDFERKSKFSLQIKDSKELKELNK